VSSTLHPTSRLQQYFKLFSYVIDYEASIYTVLGSETKTKGKAWTMKLICDISSLQSTQFSKIGRIQLYSIFLFNYDQQETFFCFVFFSR